MSSIEPNIIPAYLNIKSKKVADHIVNHKKLNQQQKKMLLESIFITCRTEGKITLFQVEEHLLKRAIQSLKNFQNQLFAKLLAKELQAIAA